jgi:aspartate/methionine/tyrosine aminotransferase
MFSSRVPARLESNRLSRALDGARSAGRGLIDLTLTNPTRAGLGYPAETLAALSEPAALTYSPEPFGLRTAREAVAADYRRRGLAVDAGRIVLTASTSEAYSMLFKLLCAPAGDAVQVPVPSYPLFEHLSRLDGVATVPYRLDYHEGWSVDLASIDDGWRGNIRAVLAVSPNNPTGSVLSGVELDALAARCADREAALVIDEVFADYPLSCPPPIRNVASRREALTFRLGGLSKSAALPQVKLGWIAVDGPEPIVEEALARLELVCDTYLSVSTPVQVAAPALIAGGAAVREQLQARIRGNDAALRSLAREYPAVTVLRAEAGWSAVLRVPAYGSEEEIALDLLERDGVVVHPGYFFDFPHEAFLVISLLPPADRFLDGVRRLLERVHA